MRPILVTGFGAFLGVHDNPTETLARQVDGLVIAGTTVVGRVLPVTFAEGPAQAVALARELDACLVVGLGVASNRDRVMVEAVGRRQCSTSPDTDGVVLQSLGEGPDEVPATLDPERLAALLGAEVSHDAGGYVCNAWAWTVPQALDVPAAFVHVPPAGLDAEVLLAALRALVTKGPGATA